MKLNKIDTNRVLEDTGGIENSEVSVVLEAIASTFDLFLRLLPSEDACAPGNSRLLDGPIELLLRIGE